MEVLTDNVENNCECAVDMSPKYVMNGQFSVKSNAFSFGVLVLEIISGQKNCSFQIGENIEHLLSYVSEEEEY